MIVKKTVSYCSPSNKIFIINFLSPQETNQLEKLIGDFQFSIVEREDYPIDYLPKDIKKFDIKSKDDFNSAKEEILNSVNSGIKPLLHIQGHGDKELGIETESKEYISWITWIDFFKSVITASNGYLTVIAACCYSYRIKELVNEKELLPYSFFYGFDTAIEAGSMWSELAFLYNSLLQTGGKELNLDGRSIKLHCEMDRFDYVLEAIATSLDIGYRNISQRSIKKSIPPIGPASVQREFLKDLLGSGELVFKVIQNLFWPTELREEIMKNVKEAIDTFKDNKDVNRSPDSIA